MEEHHSVFYADLPYREKTRLREDVHEFLCLKLKHNEVKQCRLPKGDGIPRKLTGDFNKWIKSQIKAGVFGKGKAPARRSSLSSNSSAQVGFPSLDFICNAFS
jgi:hypothetical protein